MDDQEGNFERTVLPNERVFLPDDFHQPIRQTDCMEYSNNDDIPTEGVFRSCVKTYRHCNHKSEVLFAMTIGFLDYDKMVAEPPFSLVKRKNTQASFTPTSRCLQQEIHRRCHFLLKEYPVEDDTHPLWHERTKKIVKPRPKQWARDALLNWLKQNTHKYYTEAEESDPAGCGH